MTPASALRAAYGISAELADALVRAAAAIGIDPAWLAGVIAFESGFRSDAVNSKTGATGLIQIMPATAAELGTTTAALRSMSAVSQLQYVISYFMLPRIRRFGVPRSQFDTYMAVFYPAAIGNPGYVFSAGVAAANPGIRTAADYATKASRYLKLQSTAGLSVLNLPTIGGAASGIASAAPGVAWSYGIPALGGLGVAVALIGAAVAFFFWKQWRRRSIRRAA